MTSFTPDLQEKTISAGLALAMYSLGEHKLPSNNKTTVELAFGRAWKSWDYKGRFPSVSRTNSFDNRRSDPFYVIKKYDERKTSPWCPVVWDGSQVVLRPGISWEDHGLDSAADGLMHENPIPGSGWVDLATSLLKEIKE